MRGLPWGVVGLMLCAALLQPQTRTQFEQHVFQVVRADLMAKAGINPRRPAQVEIIWAEFRAPSTW